MGYKKVAMTDRKLAVVLVSGGLDSCVTAAVARRDFQLAFFHANYGQRTVHRELRAFRELAVFFQPRYTYEAELNFLGHIGGSSLTDTHLPVPETAVEPPGLPSTYVPFRNTIIIAAAVAWAEVIGATAIFIGANMHRQPRLPRLPARSITRRMTGSSNWAPGPNTHIPSKPL